MSFYKKVDLPPIYQFLLKKLFPQQDYLKVLDLGCGLGTIGKLLNADKRHYFTGIDFFQPYLDLCKKNGYYNQTIKADLTKINLTKKSYDVILILQVLEHLTTAQAKALLKQADKAAKRCIIITLPNGDCYQEKYDHNKLHVHQSTWTSEDLKTLGFRVYGQSFKPIFGKYSYGPGKQAKLWQQFAVAFSVLLAPLIFVKPEWGAQLIGIKHVKP